MPATLKEAMVKPHIYRRSGEWRCRSTEIDGAYIEGWGETPRHAYSDWIISIVDSIFPEERPHG